MHLALDQSEVAVFEPVAALVLVPVARLVGRPVVVAAAVLRLAVAVVGLRLVVAVAAALDVAAVAVVVGQQVVSAWRSVATASYRPSVGQRCGPNLGTLHCTLGRPAGLSSTPPNIS